MNTDEITLACARAAYEAERAYANAMGDDSMPPWVELPEEKLRRAQHVVLAVLHDMPPKFLSALSADVIRAMGMALGWKAGSSDPVPMGPLVEVDGALKVVATHYGVSVADLKGRSRLKRISLARHVAIYVLRKQMGLSFPEIGKLFGGRDHTTIMASVDRVEQLVGESAVVKRSVERIGSVFQASAMM